MKRNIMGKNLRRAITKSLGRYIAIVAIIALGAGMFVGLLSTKSDMVATAQKFTDDQNMFDLRLLCTYGWTDEELAAVAEMTGVVDAEGFLQLDVVARQGEEAEEQVYRLHSIPTRINQVYLLGGRMPERPDECLVDGAYVDDSVLGTQFVVSAENEEETLQGLAQTTFTVVGYVTTPLYMDMTRGTTTIGNGDLESYVYIPAEAFTMDYYTEIGVTIPGEYDVYSDEFTQAMDEMADSLKPGVTVLAQNRYTNLKTDAEQEYADGLAEYEQGIDELAQGKQEAQEELLSAMKELKDAQKEIDSNWAAMLEGEKQLADAQALLDQSADQLNQSQQELANAKAETYAQLASAYEELMTNYKTVSTGLNQVEAGLAQIDAGISQLESGLTQLASGIEQVDLALGVLRVSMDLTQNLLNTASNSPVADPDRVKQLEEQLASQQEKMDEYTAQREELVASQEEYTTQLEELNAKKAQLSQNKADLDAAMAQIELGFMEIDSNQLQAENQFASAQAKIDSGLLQLEAGQGALDLQKEELDKGRAELEAAKAKLGEGWTEFKIGKAEAEAELADAEARLLDAQLQLDDARQTIDSMEAAEVYLLTRNTNVGYLAVNSNSDIVAGVSRVFPAFFLLVAALVCITTMTRMVDEERTQIGIFKAMGYSNWRIINKYLLYSGSAAVIGCGMGVIVGSIVFPKILWAAYSIILFLTPDIELRLNWPLCVCVVGAYTTVSMLVTWYCCRRELREVPAELIRPKAPTAGKKILLEYLPFWNKISFLNKVMFRNVFRYRQRFLMMILGIGGCTALLLTGFGIRDSIVDIVNYQYEEVTTHDIEVYFSEGQTHQDQDAFRETLRGKVDEILFYHRSSVDLDFNGKSKSVDLLASDEKLKDFVDLHADGKQLGMPGLGEAYLTIGAAEAMGIEEGDTVILRNSEMRTLTVTITGIFDNHVNNFAIIRPETIEDQWGETPETQMARINVGENQDVHAAAAKIAGVENVMSVSVSQDIAEQVSSMLKAMDLVVITVVICAALLAVIVLYNLTNISITERIREIATIKVLGFNEKETAAYVFKENLFLSALGAAAGLVGGIFLLKFVMSQIKIDMVWFQDRLTVPSYIWAVLLTMVSACIVDLILSFKLEKINMAEALKSVE